jgi:outer membrane protein OmpA-like peptidoglycan-associated protein
MSYRAWPAARIAAAAASALLVAACETPVSLQEAPRRAPLPPVTTLPAPAPPAPALPAPAAAQPLPSAPAQALPVPPVPSAAPPAATPPAEPPLVSEQRWLAQWFAGTPVVIGMPSDGALRVEVPLEFSFDPGSALIKPPLAAVLDRVAASARRLDAQLLLETPAEADARLAQDRATAMRQHLAARGVAPTRIADAPARGAAVSLLLTGAAP